MGKIAEGKERFPGPMRDPDSFSGSYQQPGDRAFKSPHSAPSLPDKPLGLGMKGDAAQGRDSYTGIPGDGIVPR